MSIGINPYVVFLHTWFFGGFLCIMGTITEKDFKMAKIKKVSIYDMDGTIVCSLHRYRTIVDENGERIDLNYWRENQDLALNDSLLPLAEQYKKDLKDESCYVIIATPDSVRPLAGAVVAHTIGAQRCTSNLVAKCMAARKHMAIE